MEPINYILPITNISPQINLFDERLTQQNNKKKKQSSPSKNKFQDILLEYKIIENNKSPSD